MRIFRFNSIVLHILIFNIICRHPSLSEAINVSSSGFFCEVISRQIESQWHGHNPIFSTVHCLAVTETRQLSDPETMIVIGLKLFSHFSQCTAWWWLTVHCMVVTGSVSGDNDRIGNINSPHQPQPRIDPDRDGDGSIVLLKIGNKSWNVGI